MFNTRIMIHQPFLRSYWSKLYMFRFRPERLCITRIMLQEVLLIESLYRYRKDINRHGCVFTEAVEYGIIDKDSFIPLVPVKK
ncbi:hypothetical protein GW17_00028725 [Ensete ventricosum]|nr:hypothetical protein GW17_00028725 [Ensete ventricosum]